MPKGVLALLTEELKLLRRLIRYRLAVAPNTEKEIVEKFHQLYYSAATFSKTWSQTLWLGTHALKCPFDLWIYQEIIHELKPELIVETGTAYGGSALFLASCLDLVGKGQVITIDIENREGRPQHKRINYLLGSSTWEAILARVTEYSIGKSPIMVILDSLHSKEHVLNELRLYSKLVTYGSYLIVEDTNINGHPVEPNSGPGPMEAVLEFMNENSEFLVDRSKEKFYLTFNPGGYLKKVAGDS